MTEPTNEAREIYPPIILTVIELCEKQGLPLRTSLIEDIRRAIDEHGIAEYMRGYQAGIVSFHDNNLGRLKKLTDDLEVAIRAATPTPHKI